MRMVMDGCGCKAGRYDPVAGLWLVVVGRGSKSAVVAL